MEGEERAALIRRGNELFNNGDYKNSLKIFLAVDYKDGIIRVADYLYFDKQEKFSAIKLYKKAGHKKVIDDFAEKAAMTIRALLTEDRQLEKVSTVKEESFIKEWKPVVLSSEEISNLETKSKDNKEEK